MLGIFTVIEIACTVVLAQCVYYRYLHPLSCYPGPFFASFSDLWKFFVFFGGEHHLVEQKLHEKYGHVVRTGPDSLSFSDLADFDAIYGFNKFIEKGDFYHFSRENRQIENVFSARTDASHREHRRKVVGPSLSAAKVASYEPTISKNAAVLISRIKALAGDCSSINVATLIHRYTLDTVVEIIYGAPLCPQAYTDSDASAGILNAFKMTSKVAWGASLLPWLGWLMSTSPVVELTRRPTFDAQGRLTGIAALASRTQDIVIHHPEQSIKSSQPSLVKNYLSVPKDHSSHMSPAQTWRESFNLTFAGPGSTAAALTTVLYHLSTTDGQKWQSRIRAEDSGLALSSSPSSPAAAAAAAAAATIPPVLTAIIKETLRLHAPFPTAFPRVIAPGAESALPGLRGPLPVGTTVYAHTFIVGRAKAVWGADAEVWRPERWLRVAGDGESESERERRELEERFVVFGKGARGCVGRDIAMLMIARAVLAVLAVWDVRAGAGLKGKSWLEMQYEECVLEFTELKR